MTDKLLKKDEPAVAVLGTREYGIGVLRGLLGAIPYVGTLLNEIAFEARSRIKQARLQAFVLELSEDIRRLAEDKIDKEYIASEEFSDLFEDVATRVARTRDERKRAYFRNVLVKGICGSRA